MNTVTIDDAAHHIQAYLRNEISIADLVDWAEQAMMEAEFEPGYEPVLRDITTRLGVADVHEFGLTWHEWEQMLHELGYQARIEVVRR